MSKSELINILEGAMDYKTKTPKTGSLLKDCKVQYGVAGKDDIYSMKIYLNKEPRILTFRVSEKFVEISLANLKGDVLESFRREKDTLTYEKKKK